MHAFPSTEKFSQLISMATFVPITGKTVEGFLAEFLQETFEYTPRQGQLAAKVMSTLVRARISDELDPLAPARAIAGTWRSTDQGNMAKHVAFRDDLTYSSFTTSGSRMAGIYIAGIAEDGYIVALCSLDGGADEMEIFPRTETARIGRTSLTRLPRVRTAHGTLIEAAAAGDLADMAKHIDNGANLNQLYDMGEGSDAKAKHTSILHFLAYGGPEEAVEALLAAGADSNVKDSDGQGPLYAALAGGRATVVERLLKHGTKVDERFRRGNTALHIAVVNRDRQIAQVLLRHGASPRAKNDEGFSPLQLAKAAGLMDLMSRLGP